MITLHNADCLTVLKTYPDNHFDSVVTDPPYHLTTNRKGGSGDASVNLKSPAARSRIATGFMNQEWDGGDIAFRVETWQEVLRVLKPGGHLLAFSASRTYHRMAVAVEDAGFEIRDQIMWLYGSGFPKSLDVAKQFQKQEDTKLAEQWDGWGTALKPAHEPIVMARKPLIVNTVNTVKQYGAGAVNIDGCRVAAGQDYIDKCNSIPGAERSSSRTQSVYGEYNGDYAGAHELGRWPANVIHDGGEEVEEEFAKYGEKKPATSRTDTKSSSGYFSTGGNAGIVYDDRGTASRFFYCAKASKKDREEGLEDLAIQSAGTVTGGRQEGSAGLNSPRAGAGRTEGGRNIHPTVKPTALMRYLIKLVTPPGGKVLDPFMGSGSTGKAAMLEGVNFVGVEMKPEFFEIAQRRIQLAEKQFKESPTTLW